MTTQLTAIHITATGQVYGQPTRVRGISFVSASTAGTITLKDGGSSGTTVAVIDLPGSSVFGYIKLVDLGLKFNTTCYATLSGSPTGITFYLG